MCKAFSCIATRKKVYWKLGVDSHNDIAELFNLKDDGSDNFCPVEITPKNKDYINPDKWVFKFDDKCPDWWKQSNEAMCWAAKDEWYKQIMNKVYKTRIKNIINPLKLPMVKQVTKEDINNLKKWDSVGDSVWNSVWDLVGDLVGDSVRNSVWDLVGDSVGDSVRDSVKDLVGDSVWNSVGDSIRYSVGASVGDSIRYSVGDSVWAYIGWNFKLNRSDWKHTENIKTKEYPFMPLIKLWKRGLIPCFDRTIWRLHSGNKAKIVFEITKEKLEVF